MADEPRRSGRATKGQHTKNQEVPDAPAPKRQKGKSKATKAASAEPEPDENDENAIIRCVCGHQEDEGGRVMICCDSCEAWQHNDCMGVPEEEGAQPDQYFCEQCRPDLHKELLDAIARGEPIWEERQRKAEEERKERERAKKRGKGSKKGGARKSARPSDIAVPQSSDLVASSPKTQQTPPSSVGPESTKKRKRELEPNGGDKEDKSKLRRASDGTTLLEPTDGGNKDYGDQDHTAAIEDQSTGAAVDNSRKVSVDAPPPPTTRFEDLPAARKIPTDFLRKSIAGVIRQFSREGSYRIPDTDTSDTLSQRLAVEIEHALFTCYGGNNEHYRDQFRAIGFNIKKNTQLLRDLLEGKLTADRLAQMTSEEMADEETKRRDAAMKEAADKQAVLVHDEGPRIRKTHKGEEFVDDESSRRATDTSVFTAPPVRRDTTAGEGEPQSSDTPPADAGSPGTVELPEDVGRQALTVDTAASPKPPAHHRQSSAAFDINTVWSSVQSSDPEQQRLLQKPPRRRSSMMKPQATPQVQGPGDDADIDRLLKDEDNDEPMYSPVDQIADPASSWRGKLLMKEVAGFNATARYIMGGDVSHKFPYQELLPSVLEITGRIKIEDADRYMSNMRWSTTNDVAVLSLTPAENDLDRQGFQRIYNYFSEKQRWAVVPQSHHAIRDIYIIPVEAGMSPMPGFLEMLDGTTIEKPRPDNMLLVTLVVRTKSPVATPHQQSESTALANAALPGNAIVTNPVLQHTPSVAAQPQFSPVGPRDNSIGGHPSSYGGPYAQQSTYQPPYPPPVHGNILANQILGPFSNAPVVIQLLTSVPDITEQQLRNLRDILEHYPATRDDISMLSMHLSQKSSSS